MPRFKVVAIKHRYPSTECERAIVTGAGGDFVDADGMPLDEALSCCEDADAILVRWLQVGVELIRRLHRCKIIVRYGVGYDNVDLRAATDAGILVGYVPSYCSDEVATHALALLLACARNLIPAHRRLASGGWEPNPPERAFRMAGRTIGLVGLGNIGRTVARKLRGWGVRLLASDPYVEQETAQMLGVELVKLEKLLQHADFVSLHVPFLPETRHLIGSRAFELMKPGAILVNTSRGPVVDTKALLDALEQGKVGSVGLDVFETEPLESDSPLRSHPRVVLTDHYAWYSEESLQELRTTAAQEAVRACTGRLPISIANPEVLHRLGRAEEWTPTYAARWQMKRLQQLRRTGVLQQDDIK